MMKFIRFVKILFWVLAFLPIGTYGQSIHYFDLIHQADSLFNLKDFKNSSQIYSQALRLNPHTIIEDDYYKAIIALSYSDKLDSSFILLNDLDQKKHFSAFKDFLEDSLANKIRNDKRWPEYLKRLILNHNEAQKHYLNGVKSKLERVFKDDQRYRQKLNEYFKKYGVNSHEVGRLYDSMAIMDNRNLKIVMNILNKYGWMGKDKIGDRGETAIWTVIQHADDYPNLQFQYLKMFKKALDRHISDSKPKYALLKDRVFIYKYKYQIFGTQLYRNSKGKLYPLPIKDSIHVDQRRAEFGLPPLKYYLYESNK